MTFLPPNQQRQSTEGIICRIIVIIDGDGGCVQVQHSCHSEAQCPPCPVLTQKWCHGSHELRSNIPCYLSEISCGLACNKPLQCSVHKCLQTCHKVCGLNTHTTQRRGIVVSDVRRMNEVNACWARLVPGWVTVFGWVYHLGM